MGHLRGDDLTLFADHIVGRRAVMLEGYARCIRIISAKVADDLLELRCEPLPIAGLHHIAREPFTYGAHAEVLVAAQSDTGGTFITASYAHGRIHICETIFAGTERIFSAVPAGMCVHCHDRPGAGPPGAPPREYSPVAHRLYGYLERLQYTFRSPWRPPADLTALDT